MGHGMRWVVLLARVPAEPSRHRVAVWRELRRLGAVAIGQSVWALPDHQAATSGLGRIAELVARGDGELTAATRPAATGWSGCMPRHGPTSGPSSGPNAPGIWPSWTRRSARAS
jgi:hypothetical protein